MPWAIGFEHTTKWRNSVSLCPHSQLITPIPGTSEAGIFDFPWFTLQEPRDNICGWEKGENESLEKSKSKINLQIYKIRHYFSTHDALSAQQGGI